MRRFSFIILFFITFTALGQPKGYTKLSDVSSFQIELKAVNASLKSIKSDFKQIKNLSLLEEKIQSKGDFYYQKQDKVRIEYTEPYQYLMIINNGKMLVKDEQKTSKINARSSKMMQSINRIMIDCMQGSVFENPDFEVAAYTNSKNYLLLLTPTTSTMKKMFNHIEVYMNRKGLDVTKLVMVENGGDFTDMSFFNTKHNIQLNEALFKVK
ncbi:MAG: outer membrane lipoprotein carrier protein LolA [Flavipsychrobacter sp.]